LSSEATTVITASDVEVATSGTLSFCR
jgi:hypothetical protein